MQSNVRVGRVYATTIRSWLSFFVAFAAMVLLWAVCYVVILRFVPGAVRLYVFGTFIAVSAAAVLLLLNEPLVKMVMNAKRVRNRNEAPELWDAVRAVTPWYAHPVPRIYLVQTSGMNAFAFGLGLPYLSAVGATTGLVEQLEHDELKAVMAHELGHIVNRDILVSTLMTTTVLTAALTGWLLLRVAPFMSSTRTSSKSSGWGMAVLFGIGFVLYVFGRAFGYILQMFVSRQREYAADAASAKIMGSSRPLASALRKITRRPSIGSDTQSVAFGFMCTADPAPDDFLSTHPSMANRLKALADLEA